MASPTFRTTVEGVDKLVRELKLANPRTKAAVAAAIQKSTKAVAAGAKARAPKRSGVMAGTIRDEYSEDGLAGFIKVGIGRLPRRSRARTPEGLKRAKGRKRKIGPGAYAPVIEHGDAKRNREPHPFLQPPFEAQIPVAVRDINGALNRSVEEIGR